MGARRRGDGRLSQNVLGRRLRSISMCKKLAMSQGHTQSDDDAALAKVVLKHHDFLRSKLNMKSASLHPEQCPCCPIGRALRCCCKGAKKEQGAQLAMNCKLPFVVVFYQVFIGTTACCGTSGAEKI
eukprot:6117660-Amphidinium_carterae.1